MFELDEELDPVTGLPAQPVSSPIEEPAPAADPNYDTSMGPPAPVAPEQSSVSPAPAGVDPMEYIRQKYGIGLRDRLLAGVSAIGAGFSGTDPNAAANNTIKNIQDEKASNLKLKTQMDENDVNSPASDAANDFAKRLGYNGPRISAAKFNAMFPKLKAVADLEARKAENQSKRDEREDKRTENAPSRAFKNLPEESQQTITGLSKKNVNKDSIANQIDAVMNQWDAWPDDQKLQQGKQLIKVLNSTEGQDAAGAEEVKRLAGKLQFALGNLTNDNPVQFGRDLAGFKQDALNTVATIRSGVKANNALIDKAYGRQTKQDDKKVLKKQFSPSRNKTRVIYSDGTEEMLDGKQ